MTPTVRSAAGSDIGCRRAVNQDSAYTSSRLVAVADGMGGHAHGEVASAVAINAVAEVDASLDGVDLHNVDLLSTLGTAMDTAASRLTDIADSDPSLRGTGTTLVALLIDGTRVGVGHIGDSRAYLLRDGRCSCGLCRRAVRPSPTCSRSRAGSATASSSARTGSPPCWTTTRSTR